MYTKHITDDIIKKRYIIICYLGEGASSIVYKAHDKKNKINVALKQAKVFNTELNY